MSHLELLQKQKQRQWILGVAPQLVVMPLAVGLLMMVVQLGDKVLVALEVVELLEVVLVVVEGVVVGAAAHLA